jgi:AcrR family transcriptional regulator
MARGRPYDEQSTHALLTAALRLIAEHGYHETSLEMIANEAGSSKATVYRRWPSKAHVMAEAVRYHLQQANPVVPKGKNTQEVVTTILRNTIHRLQTSSLAAGLRALLDVAHRDPVLGACFAEVEHERRQLLVQTLIPCLGEEQAQLTTDALLGAIYFRLYFRQMPASPAWAEELVELLLPPVLRSDLKRWFAKT